MTPLQFKACVPPAVAPGRQHRSVGAARQSRFRASVAAAAAAGSGAPTMAVPISVLADSYKATHYLQYPDSIKYSEFRQSFDKDTEDERIVVFGIRYLVEKYLQQRWTTADVEMASDFFRSHLAPNFSEFPFPKELFVKFIEQNDGYFPVKVQALRDGTCIHPHVPVFQITAEGEWAPLCTYLETILSHVWYPSTVATLSRRTRQLIEDAFDRAVPDGRNSILVPSKLVDFGFRGCTCVEQAVLGGTAHLLNFSASDTMPASFYAQFHLNNGKPVGSSIPATEHSVMTSWPSERDAMENMIERFGTGIFACVMDSYDYAAALSEALPAVAAKKVEKGGFIVLRPDSGDPTEAVLMGLRAAEKVFGATSNAKGYKSPVNAGVIQGDGVSYATIRKILDSVIEEGFSPEAVSFGMGAGLLQKVNRDTLSFATKLSHIVYADGMKADKMKYPVTDRGKISMPGELAVKRVDGIPTVFPKDSGLVPPEEDLLETVYDCGPVEGIRWQTFDEMQGRVNCEWRSLPRTHDVLSQPLKQKIDKELKAIGRSAREDHGEPERYLDETMAA